MGGVYGHLSSIWENKELTFSKLKKILSDLSNGKIKASEKLDGSNIFLSFNSNALCARSNTDIKNGGLNLQSLPQRELAGEKSYLQALQSFDKICKTLDNKILEQLFQIDGNQIWYNCEIIGRNTKNIINYDYNYIVVHALGTLSYNPNTKELIPLENESHAKFVNKIINQLSEQTLNIPYQIKIDNVFKLNPSNQNDLKITLLRLNKLLEDNKLSDKNTIEELLKLNVTSLVNSKLPEISEEIKENIIENILGKSKLSLPLGSSKELRNRISSIKKEGEQLLKKSIFPLEEIINDFSVSVLNGLESPYILNNNKEIQNIKNNAIKAIKTIQNSNNQNAIEILQKQLAKLKNVDNINTPIEGIVFDYDGQTYKLTGNFAPINQIIGLLKYGKGEKIPPLQSLEEDSFEEISKSKRYIAAIPGSFKPAHNGHYQLIEYFSKMPQVEKVFIFISPKERVAHSVDKRIVINSNMSQKIWEIYTKGNPKVEIQITKGSPVSAVYDFMDTLNPGDVLLLGQSEKEKDGSQRFGKAQEYVKKNNLGIEVKIINAPIFSNGISGTLIRDMIVEDQKEKFLSFLPKHLSSQEKNLVWQIVNEQPLQENFINEIKRTMTKNDVKKENKMVKNNNDSNDITCSKNHDSKNSKLETDSGIKLKEESSMGGGSIQGALNANKEENFMKSRKEFIEELQLKECINTILNQKFISIIKENILKQFIISKDLLEENKLRKEIKKILLLEVNKDSDSTPEATTGINVLRELLKKIIPIIETDYKSLTTSIEQRNSFRAHLLRAIKGSIVLGQEDIVDTVQQNEKEKEQVVSSPEEELEEQKDDNINIKVDAINSDTNTPMEEPKEEIKGSDKQKFIDINQNDEEKPEDLFTIPEEDKTGRNFALTTFDKINTNIMDSYALLDNEEDKNIFVDYLFANLKLYFDSFENQLKPLVDEPASEVYSDTIEKNENEESQEEEESLDTN